MNILGTKQKLVALAVPAARPAEAVVLAGPVVPGRWRVVPAEPEGPVVPGPFVLVAVVLEEHDDRVELVWRRW